MSYRFLADTVLLLHLGFILYVLLGALFAARHRALLVLHLTAVAWGVAVEVFGMVCPLTYAENHFRLLAGESGYSGGFIEHYLLGLIYPAGLTRSTQYLLAATVVLVNLGLYGWMLRRRSYSTQEKPSRASSAKDSCGPQEPAG
jgi:hypothetical protein